MKKNPFFIFVAVVAGLITVSLFSQNPPLPAPATRNIWLETNTFNSGSVFNGAVVASSLTIRASMNFGGKNGTNAADGTASDHLATLGQVISSNALYGKLSANNVWTGESNTYNNVVCLTGMTTPGITLGNLSAIQESTVLEIDTDSPSIDMLATNINILTPAGETWVKFDGVTSNLTAIGTLTVTGDVRVGRATGKTVVGMGAEAGLNYVTAIGYNAGKYATNASEATFIGASAGSAATNAGSSVFVGYGAGADAVVGDASEFIGYLAGGNATNAEGSAFIGYAAGQKAIGAMRSVFIGNWCGQMLNRPDSLMIETAPIYGTNATGTGLIYGEFDTRTLVLNATNHVAVPHGTKVLLNTVIAKGTWAMAQKTDGTSTNIWWMQYDGANWVTNSKTTSTF